MMYSTLRINDSTVTWYLERSDAEALVAGLTGGAGPVAVAVLAPLAGRLVVSAGAPASVAVIAEPPIVDWLPSHIEVPAAYLYVPSAYEPTKEHPGYQLASGTDLTELEAMLQAAIRDGTTIHVEVSDQQSSGVLILNGGNLAYAVLAHSTATAPVGGQ